MRIDKFLWCIRVYKTRTLAADQVKANKVWINNELVKSSREVKLGDILKVRKGAIHFSYRVVEMPKTRQGAKLVPLYAMDITPDEEKLKLEHLRMQYHDYGRRGLGRPTKKERRELDEFTDFDFDHDEDM